MLLGLLHLWLQFGGSQVDNPAPRSSLRASACVISGKLPSVEELLGETLRVPSLWNFPCISLPLHEERG